MMPNSVFFFFSFFFFLGGGGGGFIVTASCTREGHSLASNLRTATLAYYPRFLEKLKGLLAGKSELDKSVVMAWVDSPSAITN